MPSHGTARLGCISSCVHWPVKKERAEDKVAMSYFLGPNYANLIKFPVSKPLPFT